ncbi:MAG: preprotein translocase subunit SecA [Acholeplasmatales bacterium]|nr:preprotein translocase subunit SecA [Acholeplasmatales bacterium]
MYMAFKFLDSGHREMKRCAKLAHKIMDLEPEMVRLSDEELKAKTPYFKELLKNGKTLDDILVEAYAVAREAAFRVTGMKAYFCQLIGACAIHGGNIAEMKTGEGKTLTGVFPAYLNALSGDGVHIVTVNEYLAGRETEGIIGDIYRWLGLTVGLNLRELDKQQKRAVYSCDIVYSTNSELGFDYLRDNMVSNYEEVTQVKGLNYAIIDEVDSILIDDARTPLIISGPTKDDNGLYEKADAFVKMLKPEDYEIDVETRTVALLPSGMEKAEQFFRVSNLYDIENVMLVHRINNAMKAVYIFENGKEYVVVDGEVLIVDASTGRILKGRQFSEGLHQALEAKEGVEIKKETITVATITYQNFFRMYKKLSGMTGTAKTEEEEFRDIYNMYVVEVPTNRPVIRNDAPDKLFLTKEFKFNALVKEIQERHEKGQPILVGTANVETSELVHNMLEKLGLQHEVLNAKNHAREAEIVAHAGELGAITISTNMAGRGTDIKLAPGVAALGGLAVLGTERFESRRIDNQLRGRSGRQGDPGYSRFFISTEDDLIQRFGGDSFKMRLASIVRMMNDGDESEALESRMLAKMVTMAQTKIEGMNYDSRKNVLKYDDVIRRQREIFYEERQEVVKAQKLEEVLSKIVKIAISNTVEDFMNSDAKEFEDEKLVKTFNERLFGNNLIDLNVIKSIDDDQEMIEYIYEQANKDITDRINKLKEDLTALIPAEEIANNPDLIYNQAELFIKRIILPILDRNWREHIDDMAGFRQGIHLQSYAQTDPLELYQREGYKKFETLNKKMNEEILIAAMHARVRVSRNVEEVPDQMKGLSTNQDLSTTRAGEPVNNKNDVFANVGPNDKCPCGSGKKFKFCHGLTRK